LHLAEIPDRGCHVARLFTGFAASLAEQHELGIDLGHLIEETPFDPGAAADLAPAAERLAKHHEADLRDRQESAAHPTTAAERGVQLGFEVGGVEELSPRFFAERRFGFVEQDKAERDGGVRHLAAETIDESLRKDEDQRLVAGRVERRVKSVLDAESAID